MPMTKSHVITCSIRKREIFSNILMVSVNCVHFQSGYGPFCNTCIQLTTILIILMRRLRWVHLNAKCHEVTIVVVKLLVISVTLSGTITHATLKTTNGATYLVSFHITAKALYFIFGTLNIVVSVTNSICLAEY